MEGEASCEILKKKYGGLYKSLEGSSGKIVHLGLKSV